MRAILIVVAVLLVGCGPTGSNVNRATSTPAKAESAAGKPVSTPAKVETGGTKPVSKSWSSPPEMKIDPNKSYSADIKTSLGDVTVELLPKDAPTAVNNFVFLAREGFYDGVKFHRVIKGFMVQTGDPTGTGRGGPGYRFQDELQNAPRGGYKKGTVAMANAGPNTNGSQFFIMDADYPLPPNYVAFGRVTNGQETVAKIASVETTGPERSTPVNDVVMAKVSITER
jgi:cyclophilin family peptidyl-prolyl cis-trans isomerase